MSTRRWTLSVDFYWIVWTAVDLSGRPKTVDGGRGVRRLPFRGPSPGFGPLPFKPFGGKVLRSSAFAGFRGQAMSRLREELREEMRYAGR